MGFVQKQASRPRLHDVQHKLGLIHCGVVKSVASELGHRDLQKEGSVWSRIQSFGVHALPEKFFATCAAACRSQASGAYSGGQPASASTLLPDLLPVFAEMIAFTCGHTIEYPYIVHNAATILL